MTGKRDPTHDCAESSKKLKTTYDSGNDKDQADSDSDFEITFDDFPYNTDVAAEYLYFSTRAKVLGGDLAGVNFFIERPIDDETFTDWGVKQLLKDRHLLGSVRMAKNRTKFKFEMNLIREFYANLERVVGDELSCRFGQIYVRGKVYEFTPKLLNKILGTNDKGALRSGVSHEDLAKEMTGGKMKQWHVVGLKRTQLTQVYAILHEIGCANWFPNLTSNLVTVDQADFLYVVGCGVEINVGEFIFRRILEETERVSDVLIFTILIFSLLCDQKYVVSKDATCNRVPAYPIVIPSPETAFPAMLQRQLDVRREEVAVMEAKIQALSAPGASLFPRSTSASP